MIAELHGDAIRLVTEARIGVAVLPAFMIAFIATIILTLPVGLSGAMIITELVHKASTVSKVPV